MTLLVLCIQLYSLAKGWCLVCVCVCVHTGARVLSIVFLNSSEDSMLTNLMLHPYVVVPSAQIANQSPYDLGCLYT